MFETGSNCTTYLGPPTVSFDAPDLLICTTAKFEEIPIAPDKASSSIDLHIYYICHIGCSMLGDK